MVAYTADKLLLRCTNDDRPGVFGKVAAAEAGWDYLNLVALRLEKGKTFGIQIDDYEYVMVILTGLCDIKTDKGNFSHIGGRSDVFGGLPYAVYMPRQTAFEIEALSDRLEFVAAWSPTDRDTALKLITPAEVTMELVGGGSASAQLNHIIAPGFPAHRLLVQELYTPGGNWSNYPPFKHDHHRTTAKGDLLEANLEKIGFFRFNRPGGYAYQRLYAEDEALSALVMPQHNDIVIVPRGYHPLVTAHGYSAYTLQILAGSAHALKTSDDPQDSWIRETWHGVDARLPLVDRGMLPR
jgi:5-deoxy-glucuronate isomerase